MVIMSETSPVPLHLAQSMAELNKRAEVVGLQTKKPTVQSAKKLFEEAEGKRKLGDEESSYVFYMRYMSIVTHAKLTDSEMNKRNKIALQNAEILQKSLAKRYEQCHNLQREEKERAAKEAAKAAAVKNVTEEPKSSTLAKTFQTSTFNVADIQDSLTCQCFYEIICNKKAHYLIMDCRSSEEYSRTRVNAEFCMNIPSELLLPGTTAEGIGKNLPNKDRDLWKQRSKVDIIILLDRASVFNKLQRPSPIQILFDSLTKWDPNTIYSRQPVVLEGGIESVGYKYPMLLIGDPLKYSVSRKPLETLPSDFSYPLLEDDKIPVESNKTSAMPATEKVATVVPKIPHVDRSSKPSVVIATDKESDIKVPLQKQPDVTSSEMPVAEKNKVTPPNDLGPQVNRDLKEKALQTYADKEARVVNPSVSSSKNASVVIQSTNGNDESKESNKNTSENEAAKKIEYKSQASFDKTKKNIQERNEDKNIPLTGHIQNGLVEGTRSDIYTEKLKDTPSKSRLDGGNLRKARSSPNINQLVEDENVESKFRVPQFDRRIKPSDLTRHRNFRGVGGSVKPALTGLWNLGNTCYMNSIMQCISNTRVLASYFIDGTFRDDLRATKKSDKIAWEVASLVRELWNRQWRSISPEDLRYSVGKCHKPFLSDDQQDSHEYLTFLMDWLHEDLNQITKKIPLKEQNNEKLSHTTAANAWEDYKRSNRSIIVDLFCGQQASSVRCMKCGKVSVTFETFFNLSVPIPANVESCSVLDCIQLYLTKEHITDWYCEGCKQKCNAEKKIDIWRLPRVLIIHFQRFFNNGRWCKRQAYIRFQTKLKLEEFETGQANANSFHLYGVSNHYGTMDGGHYTAFCLNSITSQWYRYDDKEVAPIRDDQVETPAAYILFYTNSRQ